MLKRLLLWLLVSASCVLALTPAGTVIRNQASAKVDDETYLSNEVDTVVRAICIPDINPNGTPSNPAHVVTGTQNQTVYLPYTLNNAGNSNFSFDLSWAEDASSSWSASSVDIYHDSNNNARLDSGETLISDALLESEASIGLIMAVTLPLSATGTSFVSPVASCATGERDEDNYAQINASLGAALQVFKTVSKSQLSIGESVEFTLSVLNSGTAASSGDVLLSDLFSTSDFDGLAYVAASASATRGTLNYFDGSSWTLSAVGDVRGLRLSIPSLQVGELVELRFSMSVLGGTAATARQNTATVTGDGGPAQVSVPFEILPTTQHHLGPKDNPRALSGGEGSSDDEQFKERLIYGQPSCFEHSLENAGNLKDSYTLELTGLPEGITANLNTLSNEPLAETLELDSGEVRKFLVCLTASTLTDAFTLTLTATSLSTNESNLTYDKVGTSVSGSSLSLVKSADIEGVVAEDSVLTYTLVVTNGNPFELNDVVISDELQYLKARDGSSATDIPTSFISASDQGAFDPANRTVTWNFDKLAVGEAKTLELKIQLPAEAPKGEVFSLANFFSLAAQELPNPLNSNTVFHGFPVIKININKSVNPNVIRVGETLTYTIEVSNPNNVDLALKVDDDPDARLAYVAGSAVLTLADISKQVEPVAKDGKLIWDILDDPELTLKPVGQVGDSLSIVYDMLVKPGAEEKLLNTAQAFGQYEFASDVTGQENAVGLSIASLEVEAEVIVLESYLNKPDATLIGRVYFDVNDDDRYDHNLDLALPGARILLSNGFQVLTDSEGRYSFRELEPGPWQVMLDPTSAPFEIKAHPEELGEGYRHRIVLQGLSVSDFILEPPLGVIDAVRRTKLIFGPLTIEKYIVPLPEGSRVSLNISSTEALPELSISDRVPGQEDMIFEFESFEGEKSLTYDVPTSIPLTDPNARWRYP